MKTTSGKILPAVVCALILAACAGCTEKNVQKEVESVSTEITETTEITEETTTSEETSESEKITNRFPYTFTDSLGRTVTLNETPQKTAVLFSSYAQIWAQCGGNVDVTVGDSVKRGFASEDAVLVNDGPGLKYDMEVLVASEPDFVICTADFTSQAEACDALTEMGIPCAAFREENLEDYLSILKIFADLNGRPELYDELGTAVQAEIEEIVRENNERLAGRDENDAPTYLFIRAGSAFSSTKAKTAEDHFACVILDEIGAKNIADGDEMLTDELSLETILMRDPDRILIVPQGDENAAIAYIDELFSSEGWSEIPAVREKRYTFLDKELYNYKPNSRYAEAYRVLIDVLYGAEE